MPAATATLACAAVLSLIPVPAAVPLAGAAETAAASRHWTSSRVSVRTDGGEAGRKGVTSRQYYSFPSVSGEGDRVAFESESRNLVPHDTNRVSDVFVRDVGSETTRRISVGARQVEGDGASVQPAISADGGYVAFSSLADDLVAGDRDSRSDIFLRDLRENRTQLVSLGVPRDLSDRGFTSPAVSAHGRFVTFVANDRGDGTNATSTVFVRDLRRQETTRISRSQAGPDFSGDPVISADGRFVVFDSYSRLSEADHDKHLADVYVADRLTGDLTCVAIGRRDHEAARGSLDPAISSDARYVVMYTRTGNDRDGVTRNAMLWDRLTGKARNVSTDSRGHRVDEVLPPDPARPVAISGDATTVSFISAVPLMKSDTNQDWDVYVRDLGSNRLSIASVGRAGQPANGSSGATVLSGRGDTVVYTSSASNLVDGDSNRIVDVFAARRGTSAVKPRGQTRAGTSRSLEPPTPSWPS